MVQERIRGKGKGKEALYRFEGEVVPGVGENGMEEEEVVVRDPRKDLVRLKNMLNGSVKEKNFRPARIEFHEFKWEVCGFRLSSKP
jgi:histone-lysine N-methyltransferase SETD1